MPAHPSRPSYTVPFVLITTLFFLWGLAHNLNPILIPHLKKACRLSDLQSALVDSAFFVGYFVMALPAGLYMKKHGYKGGILVGLLLFAGGALLFYPAAATRTYELFLLALFIIAGGLTFLETAANPYVTVLGDPAGATQRLNLSQSFNGLAAAIAPLVGGLFILSGDGLPDDQLAALSPAALDAYLTHEAESVQIPYLVIGGVVLAVAWVIRRTPLPEIAGEAETSDAGASGTPGSWRRNLALGVAAQFFYVGAQVCISSFFIRFLGKTAGIDEKTAAYYLSAALLGFMLGRFAGTFLMRYVAPHRLLALYSVLCMALLGVAIWAGGTLSIYALIGVQFFMSIMFPTIFSLSIQGLGSRAKVGSSLLIMAIAGGAVFPVVMGYLSDISDIRTAYIVPALCFLVVLAFAVQAKSTAGTAVAAGHAHPPAKVPAGH